MWIWVNLKFLEAVLRPTVPEDGRGQNLWLYPWIFFIIHEGILLFHSRNGTLEDKKAPSISITWLMTQSDPLPTQEHALSLTGCLRDLEVTYLCLRGPYLFAMAPPMHCRACGIPLSVPLVHTGIAKDCRVSVFILCKLRGCIGGYGSDGQAVFPSQEAYAPQPISSPKNMYSNKLLRKHTSPVQMLQQLSQLQSKWEHTGKPCPLPIHSTASPSSLSPESRFSWVERTKPCSQKENLPMIWKVNQKWAGQGGWSLQALSLLDCHCGDWRQWLSHLNRAIMPWYLGRRAIHSIRWEKHFLE